MTTFFKTRNTLKNILQTHTDLAKETKVNDDVITDVIENLKHGEMSIAVVGEVNRGKSTFLNALMGTKLFPSRASVCTAGVTVLDYGDEPKAEIVFKNGKTKSFELSLENPSKSLVDVISRKNKEVQDIKMVRIWYPNPFTGNGLVLVDTPGVNDPETWREDITYEYLAGADAVIMLLDPMQPLSASEVEFLEHKILGRSIANLIFVVNKIDDVCMEDRAVALGRIENILKKYVPNPTIYPLASKPALKAKQTGDEQSLNISGFPEFEEGLLDFLAKGRGGLLLKSKIQKGIDHLSNDIQVSIDQRIGALDSEKGAVKTRLNRAQSDLQSQTKKKDDLKKQLKSKGKTIARQLKDIIREKENYLSHSLKPALQEEPSVSVLRSNILSFQRDCVEVLQDGIESTYSNLLSKHGERSLAIMSDVKDIMSSLSHDASSSVQSIQVSHQKVRVSSGIEEKKAGAVVGGVIGAGAGMAAAAGAGAGIAAMGVIGLGILAGGIGLLVGGAVAGMLSEKSSSSSSRNQSSYVEHDEMVNNRRAMLAVDRFLSKLKNNVNRISDMLINSLLQELVKPIDRQITGQKNLIAQINNDLDQTVEDQQSTRDFLASKTGDVKNINTQYQGLINDVESL
ncbi:MAG: dynamin family protein [Candidatus Marinimicrobia bacterium]|nr:dynamin family protein [Candidatus Neomarinimicrobiota bacterium]